VLAACAGIIMLANNPHGGEQLKDLLVGQILWVNYRQLLLAALLTAAILVLWFGGAVHRRGTRFYLLFAVAVTASVQLVGIYLVFASLILPALATRRRSGGAGLAWGYGIGIAGYATGIAVSALFDLPTGAVIVWALAAAALAAALLAPSSVARS